MPSRLVRLPAAAPPARGVLLAQELPDRKRDAGARGAQFDRQAWLLGGVFLAALVVVVVVLASRRRPERR